MMFRMRANTALPIPTKLTPIEPRTSLTSAIHTSSMDCKPLCSPCFGATDACCQLHLGPTAPEDGGWEQERSQALLCERAPDHASYALLQGPASCRPGWGCRRDYIVIACATQSALAGTLVQVSAPRAYAAGGCHLPPPGGIVE
jgi:hypothetical protein